MYMRKAPELTLLTPQKMVLNGGLSVVAELGPLGRKSVIWVLMPTLPRSSGCSMGMMIYFHANIRSASFCSSSTLHLISVLISSLEQ